MSAVGQRRGGKPPRLTLSGKIYSGKFQKKTGSPAGVTMIEIIVTAGIITFVSAIIMVSFTGINQGAALNRAERDLALGIRQAQNMSLAVRKVRVGNPPILQLVKRIGIHFSAQGPDSTKFFLFADVDGDGRYTPSNFEKIPQTEVPFDRGITIFTLNDNVSTQYKEADIIFRAPEATMSINGTKLDNTRVAITSDPLTVTLQTPTGETKTVKTRISGQIIIK